MGAVCAWALRCVWPPALSPMQKAAWPLGEGNFPRVWGTTGTDSRGRTRCHMVQSRAPVVRKAGGGVPAIAPRVSSNDLRVLAPPNRELPALLSLPRGGQQEPPRNSSPDLDVSSRPRSSPIHTHTRTHTSPQQSGPHTLSLLSNQSPTLPPICKNRRKKRAKQMIGQEKRGGEIEGGACVSFEPVRGLGATEKSFEILQLDEACTEDRRREGERERGRAWKNPGNWICRMAEMGGCGSGSSPTAFVLGRVMEGCMEGFFWFFLSVKTVRMDPHCFRRRRLLDRRGVFDLSVQKGTTPLRFLT